MPQKIDEVILKSLTGHNSTERSKTSRDTRHKAVQHLVLLVFLVTSIILLLTHNFLPLDHASKTLIRGYTLILISGAAPALLLLRRKAPPSLLLHWSLAFIALGILYIALNTGGIHSPALIIVLVIPLIASSLLNLKAGLIWAGIIAGSWLTFAILDSREIYFTNVISKESKTTSEVLSLLVALTIGLIGAWQFHRINHSLRQKLKTEHLTALHMATHDPLTGLYNRRKFEAVVLNQIENKPTLPFCIIYLDLNGFKPINDKYGHETGDALLQEFSRRLKSQFRGDDACARLGGDEFAVFLLGIADKQRAQGRVASLLQSLSEPLHHNGDEHKIDTAFGLALYPQDATTYNEIIAVADKDMYAHKQESKIANTTTSSD